MNEDPSTIYRLPGDQVIWRSRPGGAIGYTIAAIVVTDTPQATVLLQPTGAPIKRRAGQRGGARGRNLAQWDGTYEDRIWDGPPMLRLHAWGRAYSVLRAWDATHGCASGWYINLERGWRRTVIGFDSEDLTLDITVADDLSSWAWKDEDELAWYQETGLYSADDVAWIRAVGWEAVRDLETRVWPFDADWSQWRPNSRWPSPTIPTEWDCNDI
jgi:hypothetical protein